VQSASRPAPIDLRGWHTVRVEEPSEEDTKSELAPTAPAAPGASSASPAPSRP